MSEAEKYQEQHKQRLNHMPWLYYTLKPKNKVWAMEWQIHIQDMLCSLENVHFGQTCFVASTAALFAEPGRAISIGDNSFIAAHTFIHGPASIGSNVSINQGCKIEGSKAGISIGNDTRIAAGCVFFAFNHGLEANTLISQQPITSNGITIGKDVWIGAHCGIVDGVNVGDHAVIGMNSTVTHDVEAYAIMAGSPARKIGDRREKPIATFKNHESLRPL